MDTAISTVRKQKIYERRISFAATFQGLTNIRMHYANIGIIIF